MRLESDHQREKWPRYGLSGAVDDVELTTYVELAFLAEIRRIGENCQLYFHGICSSLLVPRYFRLTFVSRVPQSQKSTA